MDPMVDMARIRRETLRWLILLTLNNARPLGALGDGQLAAHRT